MKFSGGPGHYKGTSSDLIDEPVFKPNPMLKPYYINCVSVLEDDKLEFDVMDKNGAGDVRIRRFRVRLDQCVEKVAKYLADADALALEDVQLRIDSEAAAVRTRIALCPKATFTDTMHTFRAMGLLNWAEGPCS